MFDRQKAILAVLACVLVFVFAHQVLSSAGLVPNLWERFVELKQRTGSHIDRGAVMLEVFNRSLEHPFIGHGPVILLPRGFVTLHSNNPHCQYVLYLYTIGFFGLGAFIWLLVKLFKMTIQATRASLRIGRPKEYIYGLSVLLQTFLVIFVLHETVDDYSSSFNYPLFIWYVFALIVATRNILMKEAGLLPSSVNSENARC